MPIYSYKALKQGKEMVSGEITASDYKDAKDLIRKMGLVPTELKEYVDTKAKKATQLTSLSLAEKIDFRRMDAQKLDFEDGIFDLVISRNVLWNLEQPEQAYREWLRVLKPNGTVMNFDGNFYYYVTDAEYGDRTRWEHKHMQGINANSIDRIGEHLPMARRLRPEWDVQELQKLGAKEVCSNVTNEKILEDGHHLILNFQVSAVKAQV